METIGAFLGMLIVLILIVLPIVVILAFFFVAGMIAVGAMIPMYAAFGIGFLIRGIYRLVSYIPPRRAVVE